MGSKGKESEKMGDTANTTTDRDKKVKSEKSNKMKEWFKGIKAEFKKIIWPDKDIPPPGAVVRRPLITVRPSL